MITILRIELSSLDSFEEAMVCWENEQIYGDAAVFMKNLVSAYLGQIYIFVLLESLENCSSFYLIWVKKVLSSIYQ